MLLNCPSLDLGSTAAATVEKLGARAVEVAQIDEAFDALERKVDYAEGRADALGLADSSSKPGLADEIAALASADKVDAELEAMKAALKTSKEG